MCACYYFFTVYTNNNWNTNWKLAFWVYLTSFEVCRYVKDLPGHYSKANYFSLKTKVQVKIGHTCTSLLQIKMFRQEEYHLKAVNKSNRDWTFYVYQKAPDIVSENVFSLSWLAPLYKIGVNNFKNFYWSVDYEFVWYDSGKLEPGVRFLAGGSQKCNPSGKNHTEFTVPRNGAPGLSEPTKEPEKGTLYIETDDTVPTNKFAVGIGMSGNGIFVQQAEPNSIYKFKPTSPSYWVAADDKMKVGTVLDIKTITNTAEVKFRRHIYNMEATLTEENKWVITDMTGDTDTTTNTRTTTIYNCCALI